MRLQYEIAATGVNQLKRVLRSVEQEQRASNMRAANASAKMWARQLASVKREIARVEARGIRTRTGPTTRGAAGTMAASRAAERAAVGSARRRSMVELSEAERLHRHRLEQMASEGSARIAGIKSAAREERRVENLQHRLRLRNIEREKARKVSALTRARVARERGKGTLAPALGRGLTRGVGGALAGVGRMAAGVGMLGGGFAAFGAVRNQMETEAAASTLANKALGTPGEKRNREQIRTDVIKQARGLGAKTGLGAQGVVGALSSFTAISGRLGMGQQLAPFMADVADATGAAIEDVGRTSGQIVQAMMARGMKEPEALAQTKEIITAMMAQAKVGSIEFADLATQMGKVMSSTAAFDGKVSDLTTTMGALAQLAIAGAASSPEEAMTSILRFRDDLIKNSARFQKQGINVFADKGKTRLRKPEELMVEMLEKTKGSLPKVGKLFGIRAAKAVTPFQALYTEKGGGEAGIKAVRDLLETAKATIPQTEVTRSASFRRQDADKQLAMTVEKFNAAVGSQLLPVLTQLIPKFTDMIPQIADMTKAFAGVASWAIENPLQGLGAIIGAKIAAETASAAIGPAISKGLTSLFQRAPIGSLSLGAATFAVTAGTIIIEALASSKDAGSRVSAENTAKRGAALANAEVVRQRSAQVSLSKEGKPIDETPQAALARISGITPRGKELLTTAESTMQNVQRINDVATQGVWETLVNTITGQGPGIKAVWQAQEEQKGSAKAIEDTGAMLKTLESMVTLQKDALAEPIKQLNVAAKGMQMAADKMQTVADNPPAPTPDSPRRNSPVLNR